MMANGYDFEGEEKREAQEDEAYMQGRAVPASDLDLQAWTINPEWGQNSVSSELKDMLKAAGLRKDEQGNPIIQDTKSLWGILSFYSRDMRLGNLEPNFGDLQYCQYYLDLANDLLQCGLVMSFLMSLSRAATVLELSQSKRGFFRKRLGTRTRESRIEEIEPPKKPLFGGRKQQQGGY